jgi:hypothetical protein
MIRLDQPFLLSNQPDQLSASETTGTLLDCTQPSENRLDCTTDTLLGAGGLHNTIGQVGHNALTDGAQCTDDSCRVPPGNHRAGHAQRKAGRRSGSPRRKSTRRKKRGGWRESKCLTWAEVKEIDQASHDLHAAGKQLNVFLTVKPSGAPVTDEACKKHCYRETQKVAAKLTRRDIPWIGVRVFEKTPGGCLHMHMLIHVPKEWIREVCGWTNRPVLDIKRAAPYHMQYITKQRRSLSPEAERNIRRRRQRGAPFTGRRWSLTKTAKCVLNTA